MNGKQNTKDNKRKQPAKGWNRKNAKAYEKGKQATKTGQGNAQSAIKNPLSEQPGCAALVLLAKQRQQEVTGNE